MNPNDFIFKILENSKNEPVFLFKNKNKFYTSYEKWLSIIYRKNLDENLECFLKKFSLSLILNLKNSNESIKIFSNKLNNLILVISNFELSEDNIVEKIKIRENFYYIIKKEEQ